MLPPIAAILFLAGCGGGAADKQGGGAEKGAAAPAPKPTGPAPRTPVMQITPAPGNQAEWIEPRNGSADPRTAPYGNLLDQAVVDAPPKR